MAKFALNGGLILLLATIASSTAHDGGAGNKSDSNEGPQFIPYNCYDHLTPDHFTENKNGIVREDFRWPRGVIPYVYHSSVADSHKEAIKAAIKLIQDKTCLRIVERTDEVVFVTFRTDLRGCHANGIGMRGTTNQQINLEPKGCMLPGSGAHEILHVAGLYHEHSRPDRDTYIDILKDNIAPDELGQFDLCTKRAGHEGCSTFGVPYNVKSIMHYAAFNAFGVDQKKPVMRSKSGYPEIPKDQREYVELTDDDVTKLHIMYNNCQ